VNPATEVQPRQQATLALPALAPASTPVELSEANKRSAGNFEIFWMRIYQLGLSIVDQGFSVGGMFLANVALARTQSKEEYGVFALMYSVFTFLSGLHNAAVLEAYTIYGSGRYYRQFPSYARFLWLSNARICLGLTATVTSFWALLVWLAPQYASPTLLGLALACGILLTASFVRRTFYMQQRPELAARFSTLFFFLDAGLLLLLFRTGKLNGFGAFASAAFAWSAAGLIVTRELPGRAKSEDFLEVEPAYWAEHWKYSRWVLFTALVFQFLTQGYYWLAAGFLSVKEAGELRALNNLLMPLDQVSSAVSLLLLPVLSRRFVSQRLAGLAPLWKRYCLGWLLVTSCFAVAVLWYGKSVMHVVYAGRFDDVASLLVALAFLPVILGVGNTMNAALKAMEKPQAVFCAYVASGSATLLIGIPLIVHLGIRGAAYGMLASAAVYTATLGIAFLSYVWIEPKTSPREVRNMEVLLP